MTDTTRWPILRYEEWSETAAALHLWTQVIGKVRLRLEPLVNHWWNVTLYVTPRGLTTGAMTHPSGRTFELAFDFIGQRLTCDDCDGEHREFALTPMSVADFYARVMTMLDELAVPVRIDPRPNEMPDAIPFAHDTERRAYDAAAAERFWRVLLQADRLCKQFRAGFLGKVSPVHFFWGSFDLAVTRFSGRIAPPHPGGIPNLPDWITREAYSHEVQSVGFWPGGPGADALFYAYAYPTPDGFGQAPVEPAAASWSDQMREFVLPYEAVRTADDPDAAVLAFFRSTYDAAARLANWDRAALERDHSTR